MTSKRRNLAVVCPYWKFLPVTFQSVPLAITDPSRPTFVC